MKNFKIINDKLTLKDDYLISLLKKINTEICDFTNSYPKTPSYEPYEMITKEFYDNLEKCVDDDNLDISEKELRYFLLVLRVALHYNRDKLYIYSS